MHELVGSADATERISDALRRLLREADGRALTIREMVDILHGRGLQFIVILLCLPFLTPVTIPGVSIPFGLAISLCGFRIAFGHKPWLPKFILDRRIPYNV
ncbi:MAG TPA: exopolysaccharide biosynthesis protein, partial [Terrimicrobiaceae bacterium]